MHLCLNAKHADAVSDQNITFWSHLTRAPSSSHNLNDIWLQALVSASWGQKGLSSGNPSKEPVDVEVASDGSFLNLVTLSRHQDLQFFNRDSWGFCCFSHHPPPYPGGQNAFASSTHEVFNCSISFEFYNKCPDSAQWYIQSFVDLLVAITRFMEVYDHLSLLNCQFFCFLHVVG